MSAARLSYFGLGLICINIFLIFWFLDSCSSTFTILCMANFLSAVVRPSAHLIYACPNGIFKMHTTHITVDTGLFRPNGEVNIISIQFESVVRSWNGRWRCVMYDVKGHCLDSFYYWFFFSAVCCMSFIYFSVSEKNQIFVLIHRAKCQSNTFVNSSLSYIMFWRSSLSCSMFEV